MTAISEVERLRRCRTLFQRAQAAGTTPVALTNREAQQRWAAVEARLAAKRAAIAEATTEEERQLAWWQR